MLLSSCQFTTEQANNEADKNVAEKAVDRFYNLLAEKKVDEARQMFHPSLLLSNDSVKFREFLVNLSNQAPAIKERKLDHWQTNVAKGLNAGSFYGMFYITKFNEGSELKVSIILQKDENDSIKITSYQASPDAFK